MSIRGVVVRAIAGCTIGFLLLIPGSPAFAGGSPLEVDRERYQPGEKVVARGVVQWAHNGSLGTPEDGPYFAYLIPSDERWNNGAEAFPNPGLVLPSNAVKVGPLRVSTERTATGGVQFAHATVEFTVPNLPNGSYVLVHCNLDCTTTFGDLWPARFAIGPDASPTTFPAAGSTSSTTSTTLTTTTNTTVVELRTERDASSSASLLPLAAAAVIAAAGVAAFFVVMPRRKRLKAESQFRQDP